MSVFVNRTMMVTVKHSKWCNNLYQ